MTAWVSGRFSQLVPSRSHQVRNGVEPQPVHAHVEPESHDLEHFFDAPRGLSKFRSGWCEKKRCQ